MATNTEVWGKSFLAYDINYIASQLQANIIKWSPSSDYYPESVVLSNGIIFNIEYYSTPTYGFVYVIFNGIKYNCSILESRERMFVAMRTKAKENNANPKQPINGQESAF